MRRLAPLALCLLAVAGCGGSAPAPLAGQAPQQGQKGISEEATQGLGYPAFATKNTTRVGGADAVADAAAVALAVFPGGSARQRPTAVALADVKQWPVTIAAAVFNAAPVHAPLLLSDGDSLPGATKSALDDLDPKGSAPAANVQVIALGDAPAPKDLKTTRIQYDDPIAVAAGIDRFQSAAAGRTSPAVIVASADQPAYAMPAAGYAAESGNSVLFVHKDKIPPVTRKAIAAHQKPQIIVLGPTSVISAAVAAELRKLGKVTRVDGKSAIDVAITFAKLPSGWNVNDPGHGFVFANQERTGDAGAAAALSASGTYGPLLLVDKPDALPPSVAQYLLNVQPGIPRSGPVRGVYNHGWLMGDEDAITVAVQSQIDGLLEIAPVRIPK